MSEDSAFYVFMFLAACIGAALQSALSKLFAKTPKYLIPPKQLQMKIECDNSEAVRGFREATEIANEYSALLDEINAKSIRLRETLQSIRPPKDLH